MTYIYLSNYKSKLKLSYIIKGLKHHDSTHMWITVANVMLEYTS
jgi:hypothetical protein